MMKKRLLLASSVSFFSIMFSVAASAQNAAGASDDAASASTEILVTARKRQESILKVPVVVTALDSGRLERLQATEITDLPKLVPGLNLGQTILSIGTLVSIRGVGTSSLDAGVDQSVSLNLDGLPLGQGLAFSSGMFDLAQIEVLKGPQALFYGKASPAGVISLRTADPADETEIVARAGYEIEARQGRGELIVSGPLSDTFKGRLAGMYQAGDGYFRNVAQPLPNTGAKAPYARENRPRNYVLRGTLLWNPSSEFSARFKANVVRDKGVRTDNGQLVNCPEGASQTVTVGGAQIPFISGDDCKLGREVRSTYMDPAAFAGIPFGGVPLTDSKQQYGTLELSYNPTSQIGLTSTTGFYNLDSHSLFATGQPTGPGPSLATENQFHRRDVTQEFRVDSDFASPLNFTAGAFYQDGRLSNRATVRGNAALGLGANRTDATTAVDITTYSLFGQLRWRLVPELELSAGARWTDETRSETVFDHITNLFRTPVRSRIHASNIAPEFTATYTPSDDLTLFAAYKHGFKSGSFTLSSAVANGADNSFDDEKVRGYEIGLKSRLFDRTLQLNLAFYDYRYRGLQIGATQPVQNGQPIIRTINAGAARTYGIDLDASYRPAGIEGLSLNLGANWNRARYTRLDNVPCWGGQTQALGCDRILNTVTGRFTAQDLSGTPLARAPEWQATFGFDYEVPVGSNLTLTFANSNQYSSRSVAFIAKGRPNDDNYQPSFFKTDLSASLKTADDRWELALIGKNVTDKLTSSNRAVANYAGGLLFGGQLQGGTTSGPIGLAEALAFTDPGRSIWLRVTFRPFAPIR
jgi:iron complex outermembrane receptor protein